MGREDGGREDGRGKGKSKNSVSANERDASIIDDVTRDATIINVVT